MNYFKDQTAIVAWGVDWWPFLKGSSDVAVHQVLLNQLQREIFIATCKTCNVPAPAPVNPGFLKICALADWLPSKITKWRFSCNSSTYKMSFPPGFSNDAAFTLPSMLTGALFFYPVFSSCITKVAWTSVQHFALLPYLTENRCKYY